MDQYVTGRDIEGHLHPLIKSFHLCMKMKWAHLPWPGALSDQHPEFVDVMLYIFGEKDKADYKRQKDEEQKNKSRSK